MSIYASNGSCEFLARMALGPVHQLSLWLLSTACHLEPPGPVAEVRLGRSLNLLPGRQRNEAYLQQDTCSVHQGSQGRFWSLAHAAHLKPMARISPGGRTCPMFSSKQMCLMTCCSRPLQGTDSIYTSFFTACIPEDDILLLELLRAAQASSSCV